MINIANKQFKYKTGFTLAEVLVTLAIIGVVAALTIPSLIQSTQNAGTVTRVKKIYSTLSQVYTSLEANDETMDSIFAGNFDNAAALNNLAPKLQIIKNCGTANFGGCFPDVTYVRLDNTVEGNIESGALAKVILADGTLLLIMDYNGGCDNDIFGIPGSPLCHICARILVDINGKKGPNQFGKDTFYFWATRTGFIPAGTQYDTPFYDCATTGSRGMGCAGKIILDGAVNY